MNLPRPLIDPTPDRPLKFYGWRNGRDGNVYASTAPMTHGRPNKNREVRIGSLVRDGGQWVATTSLGGLHFTGKRQQDAGRALYDWYQARERVHGGAR